MLPHLTVPFIFRVLVHGHKKKRKHKELICIFSRVFWLPLLAFPKQVTPLTAGGRALIRKLQFSQRSLNSSAEATVYESLSGLICCISGYT